MDDRVMAQEKTVTASFQKIFKLYYIQYYTLYKYEENNYLCYNCKSQF